MGITRPQLPNESLAIIEDRSYCQLKFYIAKIGNLRFFVKKLWKYYNFPFAPQN